MAQRYLDCTIIVSSLADARVAAGLLEEQGVEAFQVASLDGHALRSNGEHVVRTEPEVEQSITLRSRAIELETAVSAANASVTREAAVLEAARTAEESHRSALDGIEDERRTHRGRAAAAEQALRALEADQQRERSRLANLPLQLRPDAESEPSNVEARRGAAIAARDAAAHRADEARRGMAATEAERSSAAQQLAAVAAERALAQERQARLRDAAERDRRELQRITRALETLRDERARLVDELADLRARTGTAEEELTRSETLVAKLETETAKTVGSIASHEEHLERATVELEAAQSRLADWRTEEASAGATLEHARGTLERLRVEMEGTAEALAVGSIDLLDLRANIPGEIAGLDDESLQRRLIRAHRDLRNVGGVDYGVLAEYNRLDERYRFLTEQLEDLARTEAAIREAMEDVRGRMRTQFATAFEEVNDRFKTMFQSLFRGGDAELVLVGDQDSPQFGVDIVAQPPGKHLHRLATLSGGERALVGGALLLALIGANPSPFCMLDEVDAALDEANVQRFAGTVREMAGQTQFILVTHNRATMEAADALYGVTMSPGAVSQVLSIRLPD